MDTLKNALMAPFSDTAAAETTPLKTALVYAGIGLVIGVFMNK